MDTLEKILREIDSLNEPDKELLYREIQKRLSKREGVLNVLAKYRGRGKGIWMQEAQDHVNRLRDDDRF